jgi:tRNA(adenine34) deaminase
MHSNSARDGRFMGLALDEARRAARRGEVPVGAVVVSGEEVLSRACNGTMAFSDPTAHAEVAALRKACRKRTNHRLPDCELYVTLEPCAMCLGAAVQARVRRLVFGTADPKAGAVRSVMRFPFGKLNHRPEIRGGVEAEACAAILKDFFREKRAEARRRTAERCPSG